MRADKHYRLVLTLIAGMLAMASTPASDARASETQAAAPVIAASDGSTTCTPARTVAISDATAAATIYYTTDGSPPSTSSNLYTGPVTLTGTQVLTARAFAAGYRQSNTVAATAGKLLACDDEITITANGLQRTFVVHVPASYAAKRTQANPSPLLIDIHGYQAGETADQVVGFEIQHSGELQMSDKRGFMAIWPESTAITQGDQVYHSWAGVYCCTPALGSVDDVSFLEQVIAWGETYGLIDTKRVYVTGHSNGAQMTHRLACDATASAMVTAIAPVSWPINETADQCMASHPMPVMEVHGTADATILYDGNTVPPKNYTDPPVTISAPDGAAVWRQINQCSTATPAATYVSANGITYNGPGSGYPDMITQIKGRQCANGVYTGLITIDNAPHVVFDYALKTDDFDVAQYLWSTVFAKP